MSTIFQIQKILNEKYNINVSQGIIKLFAVLLVASFVLMLLVSCTDKSLQKSDPNVIVEPPTDL